LEIVINFKNIEDANQFEGLHSELGWIEKFQGAALLLRGGEKADQQANAAGVDHGDFFEVEDEARSAGAEEIRKGLAEFVRRLAEDQLAAQLDNFHLSLSTDFDVQSRAPFNEQNTAGGAKGRAALTPRKSSVRVTHNLEEP